MAGRATIEPRRRPSSSGRLPAGDHFNFFSPEQCVRPKFTVR